MAFRSAGSFPSSLTNWPFAARSWSRKVALVLAVGAAGVVLSAAPCRAQAGDADGAGAARSAADHADRNKPMPYKNSVPAETTVAEDEGPAGSAVIEGQISLRRDGAEQQALELLEKRLRDPGDALYHQWLSPKEMGESFPPSPSELEALTSWLASYGLAVTNVDAPRLLLTFSGPATAVGKAFSTKIHKFKMKDGLAHYANVTNPKLPGRFYGAALKLNDFGGGTTNFAGMVIGPRSGQAAKAIGPAGQGATGADKTASGGTLLRSYGFSVTPGFQEPGVATPQTLSVTLQTKPGEAAPTGDISIYSGDSLGAIGTIAAKDCEAGDEATYTCAGLWTPPAEMPTGEHRLTAAYSGDARYAPTYTTSRIVSYGSELTSTTVTASTINTDSSQSITFTSVTTWTGSGAAPAGTDTVTLTCVDGSPNEGGMGCGNLSNLPAADPVSSCTVSTSAQTITCTFSYNLDNNDLYFGSFGFQASFSGDTTYAGSNATVFVDDYDPEYAGAGTLSITPSTAYPAPGSSVTYTTVYTATTQTTNPTTSGGPTYTDITGSPITGGELIDPGNASSCTWSTSAHTLTCTFSSLVPSGLSGFYTIGSEFSGNYLDEAQSASTTLLVTNGMSSTVNVSLNPNTVSGSSGTAVTVTYTLGWTGSTAPTGTLVLSDAQGTLPTQTVNLSSCTLGTNLYTCSYTWVAASTGSSSPDKVTASYSGDGNFLPSSGSANLTISSLFTGSNTVTVANLGLSANSSQTYGTAEAVNQLEVILTGQSGDGAPNGQIAFWFGSSSQIEYFLESNAVPDNKCLESSDMISCMSVPATTSAIMPVGNYYLWLSYAPENNVYKALVSKTSSAVYKVNAATPTISFATSPITTAYGSAAYVPVTVNLGGVSATGATAPTGETVAVSVSSTADGEVASTIGGTQGATATCVTVTTTAPQAACTVYFYPSATAGVQTIANYFSATVTGAAGNYSTNTTAVKDSLQITAATPTVTITPSPATTTVGSTTAIALTATIVGTGVSGDSAPTATPSFSAATGSFSTPSCTTTGTTETCSVNYTPSGTLAAATYTGYITASVAAGGNYATATGSDNLQVNKGTVTFGTMAFSPASSEPYGTATAITISDTLTYGGSAPTGAVTYVLNGVTYTATCTGSSSPRTCSATVPAATIGALGVSTYTVTASFAGDSAYSSGTGTSGSFIITALTPTISYAVSPISTPYGSSQYVPVTVDLGGSSTAGATAPTGETVTVTVSSTADGQVAGTIGGTQGSSATCVTATTTAPQAACTVYFYPVNTVAVQTIASYFSATVTGAAGNYGTNSTAVKDSLQVTAVTPTVTITPSPATTTVGSTTAIALTVTIAGTGVSGDTAPTATPSFSAATGSFSTPKCNTSATTETCGVSYTPSGTLTAASYPAYITATEAAGGNYGAATANDTLTVSAGTVTFGTMTFSPAASENYGASVAVTISDTLAYATGITPTGAVTYVLNGVTYTATCTGSGSPLTCSATVPGATIAALAVNGYTVTASFAGDTNYLSTTGMSGTFTITADATSTSLSASPASIGPGGTSTVTATVTDTGSGAVPQGTVTFSDTTNTKSLGNCTLSNGSCSVTVPGSSLVSGANTISGIYGASPVIDWTQSTGTTTLTLTAAPATTISITPATTGSTTAGVNTATLTATVTAASADGPWSGSVIFTNTTTGATYSAVLTGSGTAAAAQVVIPQNDAGTAAGIDTYTASFGGSTNYAASGPSSSATVYWQGVLVSSDLNHDFSGLISYGSGPITVEGTVDGSKLGPFGITVYNFTTAAQSVGINFTNASSGAFSYATNCPASLAAGAVCNYEFYYDPPNGDGCNPSQSGSCTSDSSGYLQGNYEAASWKITSGTTLGIGDKGFDRSGAAVFPATLSGKAVLPPTNPLSVTPLSYTFGPLAPNELSNTLTITVTNTTAAPLSLTESTEVTPGFTITNNCPNTLAASSSCSFDVTFQSATVGTTSTQIQLGGVGGSTITVNLAGIVSANTGLQLNTVAHNFGSVGTGSGATSFGLSITNNASTAATLSFVNSPTGTSPYSVVTSGCPSSLAAGAQCSVIVNFTPTAAGTFSDVLTISSNVPILPDGTGSAGSYSDTVSFTGSGVSGGQFTASSVEHNWGSISVGTAGTNYGVQLTNTTATPLTLTLGGSPFVQGQYGFNLAGTNCGATLAVNASCELIFSFAPTATGQVSASYPVLAVTPNNNLVPLYSGGNTYSAITLLGTGQ